MAAAVRSRMDFILAFLFIAPALVLRACRPGPIPPARRYDIVYPIHAASKPTRRKK